MNVSTHLAAFAVTAASAVALLAGQGRAAPHEPAVPVAASYAELLEPIPNAVERLKVSDAQTAERPATLIPAQWAVAHHHHHHHHHHNRRWYTSRGYIWSGGAWVLRPRTHHHHHHHHHSNY